MGWYHWCRKVGGCNCVISVGVILPVVFVFGAMLGRLSKSAVAVALSRFGCRHLRILSCANPCRYKLVAGPGSKSAKGVGVRGVFEVRNFSSEGREISAHEYETVCEETLESLCDFFEELVESSAAFRGSDVTYQDGVLTVNLGAEHGVYVINRQTPNKQVWLSSPRSGPKRYDFRSESGSWVYKHDGVTLHDLLEEEFSQMLGKRVDISKCAHCGRVK